MESAVELGLQSLDLLVHLGQLATQSPFSSANEWQRRQEDVDKEETEEEDGEEEVPKKF